MPGWMEALRLASLFAPQMSGMIGNDLPSQGGITGNIPFSNPPSMTPTLTDIPELSGPVPNLDGTGNDVTSRMRQLYNPSTEATDKFNTLLGQFPQYERPGLGRTALAALSAFGPGGHKTGMEVLNQPHERAVADWKAQIEPAQQAANLERQANVNERTLAYQTVSQQLRQEADLAKQENDRTKNEIASRRADIYEFKAKNPTSKIIPVKGGNVMVVDSTGKTINTGIPSGTLSEMDKMNLTTEGQIKVEEKRQEGREIIAEKKGWSVGSIPDPNDPTKQIGIRYNADTGEVQPIKLDGAPTGPISKPGTTAGTGIQTQNLQNIQNRTQETLDALNELLDESGKLRPEIKMAVGASRMLGTQYIPATEAKAADAAIKRLKAKLVIDLIGEMKAQSKTGATGFGAMNLKELSVLENSASKLDPALDETTFENELKRIREKLKKVMQPSSGLENTVVLTSQKKPTAAELIKKYGG